MRLHISPPPSTSPGVHDDEGGDSEEEIEGEVFSILTTDPTPAPTSAPAGYEEGGADDSEGGEGADSETDTDPNTKDPTPAKGPPPLPHIFGVLAPPSLREAQASAIGAVDVIALLAGVEVRMRGVEVEVRRARKRALKASREGR